MTRYLLPLWIFVFGQMVALLLFLFLPTIGTATTQMAADTAAVADSFWNWAWVSNPNVVKLIVFLFVELLTLFLVAKTFLKVR